MALYDSLTYLTQVHAMDNACRTAPPDFTPVPSFADIAKLLPQPHWEGHDVAIGAYWKSWELAFSHLKENTPEINFAGPYLDTFFNGNLFLWDSVFALQFCRYGERAFDFSKTIDTFYRKQHQDGFICRELSQKTGEDTFHRFDPCSTGPNVFPWFESRRLAWTGDIDRVSKVFDALVAYHYWLRLFRSWPDGTYWYTGWGGGLDNQKRHDVSGVPFTGDRPQLLKLWFHHGFVSWVEATALQYMSADVLVKFAAMIGRSAEVGSLMEERDKLREIITNTMWSETDGFYYDRMASGKLSHVKSVVSYWLLTAGLVPSDRLEAFVSHLSNEAEFATAHRVPAVSADDPSFDPAGDYWNGGVWPPTTYMVVQGLHDTGFHDLAREIACNHHRHAVECFARTGTVWENYSPSGPMPGPQSKPDNVGWSGLAPVALLIEDVFGVRMHYVQRRIDWHVSIVDAFSVKRLPFGPEGYLDVSCAKRGGLHDVPCVTVLCSEDAVLNLSWDGGMRTIALKKGIPAGC